MAHIQLLLFTDCCITFSGGPYSAFAGHDASRGLATFEVQKVSDTPDDLSDLKPSELEQVNTKYSGGSEYRDGSSIQIAETSWVCKWS